MKPISDFLQNLHPTTASLNPLSANPEKWSNTLRNLPTICLNVFDHFMNLALKGLKLENFIFVVW